VLKSVERCLECIAKLNPKVNAFVTVLADQARDQVPTAAG
jgi:Asp-tRNA(Asn)/Glu-tRNA(Gln) amidotransferase A subunit family amidase